MRDESLTCRRLRFERFLHSRAARIDLGNALVGAHPFHGIKQDLLECRVTPSMGPVALRAVLQNLLVAQAVKRARRQRRIAFVFGAVTLGLDDEHRRSRAGKGAHVGQPVSERLVAKREAAMGVELLRL
jgi:hypothetical protein